MDFEALTNQHKDAVYRHMVRVCGNQEDAEDVLIEGLLKAYRHMEQLQAPEAFRAWLTQISRRVCWRLKRRESLLPLRQLSELEDEGQEIPSTSAPADTQLAAQQMKDFLELAINQLPLEYREVYQLRDVDELPGSEVAAKLGISLAAMKSRLHRARKLLREHLDATVGSSGPDRSSDGRVASKSVTRDEALKTS